MATVRGGNGTCDRNFLIGELTLSNATFANVPHLNIKRVPCSYKKALINLLVTD